MKYDLMPIDSVAFGKYGKVLEGYNVEHLLQAMENTPLTEEVEYVASLEELEKLDIKEEFETHFFGQMEAQLGYCNGYNEELTALEYHRSSEINVAVTDMILLLGRQQDLDSDYRYDKSLVEAFLVPAGTAVEMYATTLHYAPVSYEGKPFRCCVVLPKGTNYPLEKFEKKCKEDHILECRNKWLIKL